MVLLGTPFKSMKRNSVLFCESLAQILRGRICQEYNDDVLLEAETPKILLQKADEVFFRSTSMG